jgi:glutamate-1-semialdehyde 2,1-aminomutase
MSTELNATRTISESGRLFERANKHLAGGVGSGTRSPRSGWLPHPIFVDHASGSRVFDVDGNEYIDYQMGQGPLILGHRPAPVLEAVTRTINERGSMLALCTDLEATAADALAARIPSIELLRFGNSGTECVMYALRFARAFTGRNLVVRFEGHYHGWSDAIHWSSHPSLDQVGPGDAPWVTPSSTGIPPQVGDSLVVIQWNDAEALERLFAQRGEEIAAVITEPVLGNVGGLMPAAGYMETMRRVTEEHGSVLIFDEVLTGLRVARGGAQQLLGIRPDLTVLAKALGAGFPVAAFGGRREIMEMAADGRTMHGGTYNSSPLACAAVAASLEQSGREGFYEGLMARGERLADGLVEIAHAHELPACWSGVGSLFQLWFTETLPSDYRSSQELVAASPFPTFSRAMLEERILLQPPQEGLFLMSGAHTDEDVELTLAAAERVMGTVASAVAAGKVGASGGVR